MEAAVADQVHLDRQLKRRKLRQSETTTFSAKSPKSMPSSTPATARRTRSAVTNITSSRRTPSPTGTLNPSRKAGPDFPTTSMPRSPTRMAKLTSSKAQSTGDTMAAIWTANTRKRSTRASPECRTTSTPPWCGAETAKFTSTKAVNSGASTHSSVRQSSRHTRNPSATGREFLMTSTQRFSIPTATLTSSKATNITDSTTEHSR